MKLRDIKKTDFESVLERYLKENWEGNNHWEIQNLKRANEKFGSWIEAKIAREEVGKIVVPYYKYGGAAITPEGGALLMDSYKNFNANREYYERENQQFCQRIENQKKIISKTNHVKTLYLSQEPLFTGLSYAGLKKFKGQITHLDGFHRLMAFMELENKPEFIESYIAVYCSFFDSLKNI